MGEFSNIINWDNFLNKSQDFKTNKPFKFAFIEEFFHRDFYEKYQDTWYADRYRWVINMLAEAINRAGKTDPTAVALALEGMTFNGPLGEIQMRASDHQIQMPLMVSSLTSDFKYPIYYN